MLPNRYSFALTWDSWVDGTRVQSDISGREDQISSQHNIKEAQSMCELYSRRHLKRRLVSLVGWVADCRAGGRGFFSDKEDKA